MEIYNTDISCGIDQLTSFGEQPDEHKLRDLKRHVQDTENGRDRGMLLVSLNEHQYPAWEKHLKEVGFKKVGRTVRNPNTGNKIRLYVLHRKQRAN